MSTKPLEQVPFVNLLNQEIEPGDNVLVITTCTGTTHISVGKYLGKRTGSYGSYYNRESVSVSVEVEEFETKMLHKVTREQLDYSWKPAGIELKWAAAWLPGIPGTYDPNPNYQKELEEYHKVKPLYDAAWNAHRDQYEPVKFPYKRKTTLQRNRIFPLNMKIRDLAGQSF